MRIARDLGALGGVVDSWRRLATTAAADPDYYLACAETAEGYVRPHVVLLERGGEPVTVLAGTIRDGALPLKIGYRKIPSPRARCLVVERGALCGDLSEGSCAELVESIRDSLRAGEADAAVFRELRADSTLARLARTAPAKPCRDGCPSRNVRWVLSLSEPGGPSPSLSAHTKRIGRYTTKRLIKRYGSRLRVEVFRDPGDLERAIDAMETVASRAYQRRLGVGFVADGATRRQVGHQMERGWFRAFVLYVGERPCAFWEGTCDGNTFYAHQTAYDSEFAADYVGKALLVWMIEALHREADVRRIDWGFGDADYKSHYGSERLDEATIVVFAPTLRGFALNVARSAAGGAHALAKAGTRRLELLRRLQMHGRRRALPAPGPLGEDGPPEGETERLGSVPAPELSFRTPIGVTAAALSLCGGLYVAFGLFDAGAALLAELAVAALVLRSGNGTKETRDGRPSVRARLREARKRLVRSVNGAIAPLETIGARKKIVLDHRVVFVVGPPRSGTTLLVQVMDAAFDVAIFTNLLNALWGVPSWAAALCRRLGWRGPPEFTSDLGNTRSWLGFSEGPNYWLRFFPETPHVVAIQDVKPESLRALRVAVARLVRASRKPVVFKTIVNTGRLRPIAAALPEALFVVSRREPIEVAHSILEARHKRHGSYDGWLSLEPAGTAELRSRPVHEQAIEQALRTYEMIDEDVAAIGPERFLDVRYEELCDDPHAVAERIGRFASLAPAEEDRRRRVPERFARRSEVRLPADLHGAMLAYYELRGGRIGANPR